MRDLAITLDNSRRGRLGFDEAIFSEGKSVAQLAALIDDAVERGERRLFTRLSEAQFAQLAPAQQRALRYEALSWTGVVGEDPPSNQNAGCDVRVAVVCAGSSDARVCREAIVTLGYYGCASTFIPDVGVAGLWRLLERVEDLRTMDVVIVAAGMDGALPSVVGGMIPGVVIAVPTSVGYGAGAAGAAALASNLSSCAPGIVVVNIDNGYGAACAALRMARIAGWGK
jgi:hypothetical protein